MSEDNMSKSVCASCGVSEVDDVKLTECADCGLVRYCSGACQHDHKPYHEEACKKRDEILFTQPESTHFGDCPICMIPLQIDPDKSTLHNCCSKMICNGCAYADALRQAERRLQLTCPFCRTAVTYEDKRWRERIEANDPVAMRQWGVQQYKKGDYSSAVEHFMKAAELGDVDAQYNLGCCYHSGHGVEKDDWKFTRFMEEAAIGGHPLARHNLGYGYWNDYGNAERAVKHLIIAANQGYDGSVKLLLEIFKEGKVSKEVLAAALRAHQAAVDATKSPQREAAEKCLLGLRS